MNKYEEITEYYDKMERARTTLLELVGKATDKMVKWYRENDNPYRVQIDYIECPMCGYSFTDNEIDRKVNYCPECGQSLRWEEYDERKIDEEMEF